ncbi:MAG: 30S ribosomal protein S3, partial [Phycisphaerales bacterium]|nr:30S ribosomal protein S3 [Phycisphaerales bacterium]
IVIGPKGSEIDRMTEELRYMTGRKVAISVVEIREPDLDAQLVGDGIAEQLKKRMGFRRVLKMRAEAVMAAGAQGVKIQVAGRLGGAEMSRRLDVRLGSLPLSTLQANINYGFSESHTTYGVLGVKVWIYKGPYTNAEEENQSNAAGARARARGRR